jgi:hypothetical protein
MPAGLQISTVVQTFRDLEVPPAPSSYEDRANIQSGTAQAAELVTVPGLQRITRVLRCARDTESYHSGKPPNAKTAPSQTEGRQATLLKYLL